MIFNYFYSKGFKTFAPTCNKPKIYNMHNFMFLQVSVIFSNFKTINILTDVYIEYKLFT